MKKDFKAEINEVRKIVNQYDPDGLIALGAPEDEYDNYVAKIVSLLNSKTITEEGLRAVFPNTLNYNKVNWDSMLESLKEAFN
jgi:hypothetical protein